MTLISYAQNLEDVVLYRALKNIPSGFYVDVGANDPEFHSVTKAFYDLGWAGINIEPCQEHFRELVINRLRDTNINCAVGATAGELELNVIPNTGLSTAFSHIAGGHSQKGWTVEKRSVPVYPLKDILAPYAKKEIHFLKVDVEGMEHEVVQSVDLKQVRPWILVIEAIAPLAQTPTFREWEPLVLNAGYEYVYFDGVNRYYIATEHKELKESLQYPPGIFDDYTRSIDIAANLKLQQEHEEQLKTAANRQAEAEAAHASVSEKLQNIMKQLSQIHTLYAKEKQHVSQVEIALSKSNVALEEKQRLLDGKIQVVESLEKEHDRKDHQIALLSTSLSNSSGILKKTQELLNNKVQLVKLFEKDSNRKDNEIASLNAALQESRNQLNNLITTLDAEIKRLRALVYSVSAGTHLYRALHVVIGNKHYRQPNPKTTLQRKRYTTLRVSWHTHLYRAGLGIFVKGEKPWHTHLYRSFANLLGAQRYKPQHNPKQKANPEPEDTPQNSMASAHAPPEIPTPDDRAEPRATLYSGTSSLPLQKLNDAIERRMKRSRH